MNRYKLILKDVKKDFKQYLKTKNEVECLDTLLLNICKRHLILHASKLSGGIPFSHDIKICPFQISELLDILQHINKSYLRSVEMTFEQETFESICISTIVAKLWEDAYETFCFEIDKFNKDKK